MEFVPSRAQGHLIVASIRVLSHLTKRPPTGEEIAGQLGLSRELVFHILRGLEARAIVRSIENPFDVRIDIKDHKAIEELPEKAKGPDMGREIKDFHKKTEDRQKKIEIPNPFEYWKWKPIFKPAYITAIFLILSLVVGILIVQSPQPGKDYPGYSSLEPGTQFAIHSIEMENQPAQTYIVTEQETKTTLVWVEKMQE